MEDIRVPLVLVLLLLCIPQLVCFTVPVALRVTLSASQESTASPLSRPSRVRRRVDRSSTRQSDATNATSTPQHVVVVGAGVGGLAVASRLAASSPSLQVTLLEKNAHSGGRCGSLYTRLNESTFRHERGPSLLLLPRVYRDFFVDVGTTAASHGLEWNRCLPAYTVVFDDGDSIQVGFPKRTISEDQDEWLLHAQRESQRTMDRWEPNGSHKWNEYMSLCRAYLHCGLPNFIEERFDPSSLPDFIYEAVIKDQACGWPLQPHSTVLQSFFTSTKLQALASFPDLYVGLVPYRDENEWGGGVWRSTAPAVFGLLSALELHPTYTDSGVYAPMGGFDAVATSLERVATHHCGVTLVTNATVTLVTPDGVWYQTAVGDAEFLRANVVIVNADLPYATASLFGPVDNDAPKERFDWNDEHRFSCGVVAFHWCVDRPWTHINSTHAVFLSAKTSTRADQSWATVRGQQTGPFLESVDEPFNFYLHRPSHSDPTAAPEGMDSITVLVPCPTLQRDPTAATLTRAQAMERYRAQFTSDDPTLIDRVRAAVLHRLSTVIPSSDLVILHETIDTPATYADQYHVGAGSPFGLSHGLGQLSLFRPSPQSSTHPNVLFCGASTRPGNGVPLVLIGAKLVAERALAKLKRQ